MQAISGNAFSIRYNKENNSYVLIRLGTVVFESYSKSECAKKIGEIRAEEFLESIGFYRKVECT